MYMYFFFCLDTKEKDTKKKKSRLHFLATPLRNFRGQKELATLKQLFVLIRKSLRSALRCENEVGMPCGWALGIVTVAFHICVFSSFFGAVRAGRRTLRRVRGQRG
jgi:hypothetical protein